MSEVKLSLAQIFAKYDVNRNGTLDRDQIKQMLKDVFKQLGSGNFVTQTDIDNFIKDYDTNKDGKVSWADFKNMYALKFVNTSPQTYLPNEISIKIDDIFKKYDKDNNGLLDFQQLETCLQDVFGQLGVNIQASETDVINFFKDYDANGDGKITKQDFKKVYAISFHSF